MYEYIYTSIYIGTDNNGINLLRDMLSFDPKSRISVDRALAHPYLAGGRNISKEVNMFVREFIYMFIHLNTNICMCICTNITTYTYISTEMFLFSYIYVYKYSYRYKHLPLCVTKLSPLVYMYTHIYKYVYTYRFMKYICINVYVCI
jgi:serine/threonine protein kinase